jgi:hypothetical protein
MENPQEIVMADRQMDQSFSTIFKHIYPEYTGLLGKTDKKVKMVGYGGAMGGLWGGYRPPFHSPPTCGGYGGAMGGLWWGYRPPFAGAIAPDFVAGAMAPDFVRSK